MRRLTLPGIALALPLVSAPLLGQGRPTGTAEVTTNLRVAAEVDTPLAVGPVGLAFVADEVRENVDLNGDGDRRDPAVLYVRSTRAQRSRNLGLALSDQYPELAGRDLVFTVSERRQGDTDLNGDGDAKDLVLHVYDFRTGEVRNLALAGTWQVISDRRVFLAVSEAAQGSTDLNGDGDALDTILYSHDLAAGSTTNHLLHVIQVQVSGDRVDVLASESGSVDLNGDGDVLDEVLQVLDPATGAVQNLGLAGALPSRNGTSLATRVQEASQGNTDLNGDGDTIDSVLFVIDDTTSLATNVGLATTLPSRHGTSLLARVPEWIQGNTDLNGDGDAADYVLFVIDEPTGLATNVGLAASELAASPTKALVGVSEAAQGNADLNGDGDTQDEVLFLVDLATGAASDLGTSHLPTWSSFHGRYGAVVVSEWDEGDLNGDGDATDWILHVIDTEVGSLSNLGYSVTGYSGSSGTTKPASLRGRYVAFFTHEAFLGQDLNGDGDLSDEIAFYHDIRTGRTTTDGLAVASGGYPTLLSERYAVLSVDELGQSADLNGDGDLGDRVLHVRDVRDEVTHDLGLAAEKPASSDGATFVFEVLESLQGNQDLNRDGDVLDHVLFAWSPEELVPRNLGHAVGCGARGGGCPVFPPVLDGPRILFAVSEYDDGGRDLNGNGWPYDEVLHFVDLRDPSMP